MPQGLLEQLMTSGVKYTKRFGHPVPQYALRELEPKELLAQLDQALASGQPVPGWSDGPATDVVMDRPPQAEQPTESPPIAAPSSTTKRTGLTSRTVCAGHSREDSGTLSLAYFRTPEAASAGEEVPAQG
jgi:hypothetical protein